MTLNNNLFYYKYSLLPTQRHLTSSDSQTDRISDND